MVELTIDGRRITIEKTATILDAAGKAGIPIPTLCAHKDLKPYGACMVCLVKNDTSGHLVPACSTKVTQGMIISTGTEEVRQARSESIALLVSEHAGDCRAPCELSCPAGLPIPRFLRCLGQGKTEQARIICENFLAFPLIICTLCPKPCERACRRGRKDSHVQITRLIQYLFTDYLHPLPHPHEYNGKVAVIGAGLSGLCASYFLANSGYRVTIIEKEKLALPSLDQTLNNPALNQHTAFIIKILTESGIEFRFESEINKENLEGDLLKAFDAVVFCTGKGSLVSLGLSADRNTYRTEHEDIFACGNAVEKTRHPARMALMSREVSASVDAWLKKFTAVVKPRQFISRLHRLYEYELNIQWKDADPAGPVPGTGDLFTVKEAIQEQGRCLNCDCCRADTCRLRYLATHYLSAERPFKAKERNTFERYHYPHGVCYEPGKCILCGLCVRLSAHLGFPGAFVFLNRGYDTIISVDGDALPESVISICVGNCPTGALYLDRS